MSSPQNTTMFGFLSWRLRRERRTPKAANSAMILTFIIVLLHFSNAKIFFQSLFMLTTTQFLALASSSALSSLPMCDCRS